MRTKTITRIGLLGAGAFLLVVAGAATAVSIGGTDAQSQYTAVDGVFTFDDTLNGLNPSPEPGTVTTADNPALAGLVGGLIDLELLLDTTGGFNPAAGFITDASFVGTGPGSEIVIWDSTGSTILLALDVSFVLLFVLLAGYIWKFQPHAEGSWPGWEWRAADVPLSALSSANSSVLSRLEARRSCPSIGHGKLVSMGWMVRALSAVGCLVLVVGCGRIAFDRVSLREMDAATPSGEAGMDANAPDASPRDARAADEGALLDSGLADPSLRWLAPFPSTGSVQFGGVDMDGDGQIFVHGVVQGQLLLGGSVLGGDFANSFMTSFDEAGTYRWTQMVETTPVERLATGASNGAQVAFAGSFSFPTTIGESVHTSNGFDDIFLVQGTVDGSVDNVQTMGTVMTDWPQDVTMDSRGNVFLTGSIGAGADLGGAPLPGSSDSGQFLASYDAGGAFRWARFLGTGRANVDTNDAMVCIAGWFEGTVDFGGGARTRSDGRGGYLACYSSTDGSHIWDVLLGESDVWPGASDAVVTEDSSVFVTGRLSGGTINLGTGPLSSPEAGGSFVARFDASGGLAWARAFPGEVASMDAANSEILLAGRFDGTVDFGAGPVESLWLDAFVLLLREDGTHVWSMNLGNSASDRARAVAFGPDGTFAVAFDTRGVAFGMIPAAPEFVAVFDR